ncbi:hypothetical protein NQ318_009991 [Aromia moschata]|uniref:Uncharacterized protein n=1 Tax=Aromia moschata TaxID=1265417 RepID=A0AAV8YA14_9CUCU|nr:hypothetical protein NQ318_009991 [Aromia moschata]
MVRHVISVCIFCFICATHSPCASHGAIRHDYVHPSREYNDPAALEENLQVHTRDKPKVILKRSRDIGKRNSETVNVHSKDVDDYLRKLYFIYGSGDVMTVEDLGRLRDNLSTHQTKGHSETHEADSNLNIKLNNGSINYTDMCFNPEDITSIIKDQSNASLINQQTFLRICPVLLYGLVAETCEETAGNFHVDDVLPPIKNGFVWLYSILAVVLISACGVLSLAIIPVMQKKFYKPLIQFLVALAVGTLAGDALLHLLPHAMSVGHHNHNSNDVHQEHSHDENTWKGFVAMLGLTFFFIMERLILLAGKWRKGKQKHTHSHVTVLNDRRETMNQKSDTQCMDRYNPFPYCYKDIMDHPTKSMYTPHSCEKYCVPPKFGDRR